MEFYPSIPKRVVSGTLNLFNVPETTQNPLEDIFGFFYSASNSRLENFSNHNLTPNSDTA